MTATGGISLRSRTAFNNVDFPLPKNPVSVTTGTVSAAASISIACLTAAQVRSGITQHRQSVVAVTDIDESAGVDENILVLRHQLGRQIRSSEALLRIARHEIPDLARLIRIADVIQSQPAREVRQVQKIADLRQAGLVMGHMDVVRPELSAPLCVAGVRSLLAGNRRGEDGQRPRLR